MVVPISAEKWGCYPAKSYRLLHRHHDDQKKYVDPYPLAPTTLDEQAKYLSAATLLAQGSNLTKQGDIRVALAKYEEGRECGRSIRAVGLARQVEGPASTSLGLAYFSLGQFAMATAHFEIVLAIEGGARRPAGRVA